MHYFYLFNHRLRPNKTSFEFTALYIAKPIRSTSVITEKEKNENILDSNCRISKKNLFRIYIFIEKNHIFV